MNWFVTTSATSVVLFAVVFGSIEAKELHDRERARSTQLELTEEERTAGLGSIGLRESSHSSTIARMETLAPAPSVEFEELLERELAALRPALHAGPSFSSAAAHPRRAYRLTRLEVRPEDRDAVEASFLVDACRREGEGFVETLPGPWLLNVRSDGHGSMAYRTEDGRWLALSEFLRLPKRGAASLPASEHPNPRRYRHRGEHFRTLSAEMVRLPMEDRAEELAEAAVLMRAVPYVSNFTAELLPRDSVAAETSGAEADVVCRLSARPWLQQCADRLLDVPVRYDVTRGAFEAKFGDTWHDFDEFASRIRPHGEWVARWNDEVGDHKVLTILWKLDS